jgi:transmembrane sensor
MPVESKIEEAIGWRICLSDPAAPVDQWVKFTEWLEADPANAETYDAIALADDDLSEIINVTKADSQMPQNDNVQLPAKWYRRRGLQAVAVSITVALLASPILLSDRHLQTYETRLGETREIALSDGSQIAMNGGTRLHLDNETDRYVKLDVGEAEFSIRHDAANPFEVETAASTLRDLGTTFNVRQDNDGLLIEVADGAVQYNPHKEAVTISAGNRLQLSRDSAVPILSKTDAKSVGSWRRGELTYQNARLSFIAADLSRAIGVQVSISPELSNRRFTGAIRVEKDRKLLFQRLEGLLGVRARHSATGWQLTS